MQYSIKSPQNVFYTHAIETESTGYALNFLNIIFFLCTVLTILVMVSKNPIISVLHLIGLFVTIASYLIILGITFIGLSYLLVYVGAISILFLFILMLINVRVSELITESTNSTPLIVAIPMLFTYLSQVTIITIDINLYNKLHSIIYNDSKHSYTNDDINNTLYVTSNMWDGYISATTDIASIGNIMYTNYSIWLLLTSVILLLAMVGTIVITLKKE